MASWMIHLRIADGLLAEALEVKGAVLVEGLKWCGKTTTAEQAAKSVLYLDEPDRLAQNLELAAIRPSRLLEGDKPRLIDEWQIAPALWDAVRHAVDRARGEKHGLGKGGLASAAVTGESDVSDVLCLIGFHKNSSYVRLHLYNRTILS